MAKKNEIILQVGIQQLEDETLITETLANEIKAYSEHIGVDIAFDYGALPDPLWDADVNGFELFKDIPNIINIRELFVPKDLRERGYGSTILAIISTVMSKKTLIFAEASISTKEFPPIKYSLEENEDGKEVIDVDGVLDECKRFISNCGFVDVDPLVAHNNDMSRLMLFQNTIGRIAFEYIRAYIVTKGGLAFKAIRTIYRNVFYLILKMYDDDDAIVMPVALDEKICPNLSDDVDEEVLKKESWFSDYDGKKEDNIVYDVAFRNRLILADIGGQEVKVGAKDVSALIGPFSIYFVKTEDGKNYANSAVDESDEEAVSIVEKYESEEGATSVMKVVGFALLGDGIWYECDGYYDADDCVVYFDDYAAEDVQAYVGNFSSTYESE